MKPSDRIRLIKEVSASLGKENWKLIDLTLKQFKLPWETLGHHTSFQSGFVPFPQNLYCVPNYFGDILQSASISLPIRDTIPPLSVDPPNLG